MEGGSLAPLLRDRDAGHVNRPREELVFHFPHYQGDTPHSALFLGPYKAIKFYETGQVKLFEIEKDIGERTDLAPKMPDKAREMETRLASYLKEVGAALPSPNPQAVEGSTYRKQGGGGARGGGRPGRDRPRGRRPR